MRLVPAAFLPGRRVKLPLMRIMAPETLSPMLVLRRGVVRVVLVRGVRVEWVLRPKRLFRAGRAVVVVAVVLGGPLRRCIRLGLVLVV